MKQIVTWIKGSNDQRVKDLIEDLREMKSLASNGLTKQIFTAIKSVAMDEMYDRRAKSNKLKKQTMVRQMRKIKRKA